VVGVSDGDTIAALDRETLRAGLAWHYKRFEAEQPLEETGQGSSAENEARVKKVGLSRDRNPVRPWEWRRKGNLATWGRKLRSVGSAGS
jgi:endonuclease YncB( thermonuclease family)